MTQQMTLIKQNYKQVSYFGLPLVMPAEHNYIATDSDGMVFSFIAEPRIPGGTLYWSSGVYMSPVLLGYVNLNGIDWRETMVKV